MSRRRFLFSVAGAVFAERLIADETPSDLKITRAIGFVLPSRRSKVAGKNSRLDVHGDTANDRMLRLYTNRGIEGIGNCRADKKTVAKLLGKNPFEIKNLLGAGTMPVWDLLGKIKNVPAHRLLGQEGPKRVPVYDGSIYFADLLPQYSANWQKRFREEIEMGMKLGHRAFKIKIGRGSKWMKRDEGDRRDIEIVKLIRKHAGKDVLLGVDANNGYDLSGAKQFLKEVGDNNIAFAEEMFPETVEECLEFKQFIRENGWQTMLADGETQKELDAYKPFIKAKAIDIFQGDMNRFGFEGILKEAGWAREQGLLVAPHNWGSLVGFFMQLHVGRAISNFYSAEHDPLSNDVLIADGYKIHNGTATVPDAPGFGLTIDEQKFASGVKVSFDLKA